MKLTLREVQALRDIADELVIYHRLGDVINFDNKLNHLDDALRDIRYKFDSDDKAQEEIINYYNMEA